ncbi:MAG: RidA family protein, partial [Proteobacteria bacterium]|nr:RidA family protein [Pseudomonadota bacterium]
DEIGIGCRATIGVQSLAGNNCFETWAEFEIK